MTLHLFIEPIDVWMFRDGRPFNKGSDHRASSVFPPLPTVMQGVIRSHYIALHGDIQSYLHRQLPEVERLIGKPGEKAPESFKLHGPFIATMKNGKLMRYTPLPQDAYQDGDEYRCLTMTKPVESNVVTDLDGQLQILWKDKSATPAKEKGEVWLDEGALSEYLRDRCLPVNRTVESCGLFERESRFGIERDDNTRSTRQHALYEAEFIRTREGIGLYVEVEGLGDWPDSGVIGIGGEGRAGRYTKIKTPPPSPKLEPPIPGKFKIVFLTPAYLSDGWQPEGCDWSRHFDGTVKCVAAAVARPLVLGGYDMASKQHKPSRRYVPAGSVYFFEGQTMLKRDAITDDGAGIGFGQFIIGEW